MINETLIDLLEQFPPSADIELQAEYDNGFGWTVVSNIKVEYDVKENKVILKGYEK